MTYEEALIKIKPLKNKYGEYEFWMTLQEGFFPASGRHFEVMGALRMAFTAIDQGYVDNYTLMSYVQNWATGHDISTPSFSTTPTNEEADRWVTLAVAALYEGGKIYRRMSLTWHGIKAPNGHYINNPSIKFSGRSAIGALKGLAIEHRRNSQNLEAHRHGVPDFIHNLRFAMEQFFGFAPGMNDHQFFLQLVYARVLQVTALDEETNFDWVIE